MLPIDYTPQAPELTALREMRGPAVIEFGVSWCPWCQAAQPLIAEAFAGFEAPYFKVEDGKGRPLGRAFGVKLWPTLIFLHDGEEIARRVRPASTERLHEALAQLADI